MKEGDQPRRRIEKDVTPRTAQFVEQLAEMSTVANQAEDALDRSPDRHVTLWRRTRPGATPVSLSLDDQRIKGVEKAVKARALSLAEDGLADVAHGIVMGTLFVRRDSRGDLDVTHEPPPPPKGKIIPFRYDRTPEGYRDELRKLEEDAREMGEQEFYNGEDDEDDPPPPLPVF
jgi:hypothetical protein